MSRKVESEIEFAQVLGEARHGEVARLGTSSNQETCCNCMGFAWNALCIC